MSHVTFHPGRRLTAALCAGTLLAAIPASPSPAADASAWDGQNRAAVRLIAGAARDEPAGRMLRAGIEIRLDPGWKTYWRYPGDSGVPPRVSFTRSDNVAAVTLLWPAPRSFSDGAGSSIGYADRVILPLHVAPKDPARPVVLRLDLDYAICEKLCVPADARAELALDGAAGPLDAALAASEARVPKVARLGDAGPLAVRSVSRATSGDRRRVTVDIAAPDGAAVALFAEGPAPDWALPVPEPVAGALPGSRRFTFDLDGLPPGATADGAALTLTAVSADAAIEVTTRLD
jgi:DsbC/DsbD-like thiol-disulfide interchange protein